MATSTSSRSSMMPVPERSLSSSTVDSTSAVSSPPDSTSPSPSSRTSTPPSSPPDSSVTSSSPPTRVSWTTTKPDPATLEERSSDSSTESSTAYLEYTILRLNEFYFLLSDSLLM